MGGAALKGKALVAYLIVCIVWGSTYLAIKVGVMELPPFLFAGTAARREESPSSEECDAG